MDFVVVVVVVVTALIARKQPQKNYSSSIDIMSLPGDFHQKGFRDSAKYANRESQQVLSALGLMRGFMKPGGVPDESRAARVILKDLVTGKLLFTKAPPDVDQVWTQNAFFTFSHTKLLPFLLSS